MATAQKYYKQNYRQQIRVTITFQPGERLFINKAPFAAASDTDAARSALGAYNKLVSRGSKSICAKAVCLHLLLIDDRVMNNVDLAERAPQAPHTERPVLTDIRSTRHQGSEGPKVSPKSVQC